MFAGTRRLSITAALLVFSAAVAPGLGAATPAPSLKPEREITFAPIDEAAKDRSFLRFRQRLAAIVKRRDLGALRRHLHPRISMGFGKPAGVRAALRVMRREPRRWRRLAGILARGGKFLGHGRSRIFYAPYTYFVTDAVRAAGPHRVLLIAAERVNLRARPDRRAKVLARLSHVVVHPLQTVPARRKRGWRRVRTADGTHGWVAARFAASPLDYRAGFVRYRGRWTLSFFLAGN